MATDQTPLEPSKAIAIPSADEMRQRIQAELSGQDVPDLTIFTAPDNGPLILDGQAIDDTVMFLDGMLIVQLEDGAIIVITDIGGRTYEIEPVPGEPSREQIQFIDSDTPQSSIEPAGGGGSGEQTAILDVDPLIGLPFNPLLPPTVYPFVVPRELEWAGAEGSESRLAVVQIAPAIAFETDGPVTIQLAEFAQVQVYEDGGETIESVSVTIEQLPVGTIVTQGTLETAADGTLRLTFTGDGAAYNALQITFPTDFSTASRSDINSGPLSGSVSAVSNFGSTASLTLPIRLVFEGDVTMDGPGTLALVETDDVLDFRPADALTPRATDLDGSEEVTSVTLTMPGQIGLPSGTLVSYDGGTSFGAVSSQFTFSGTLVEYEDLIIRLPADFSTENPATSLRALLTARTNEGGVTAGEIDITVGFELDVDLSAPAEVSGVEDGNGGDGSGVTVDLGIVVAATDLDRSEDSTTVEIVFTDLPAGALFSGGSFDAASATWTGSMDEANALSLFLPGDYSGTVTSVITALSPEGQTQTGQTITIDPAGDIDFAVTELTTAETDAVVTVIPSTAWQVSVSDFDPGQPAETLDSVTLTLNGLPAGVTVSGVPAGSVTYDAATGGTLVFTGSAAEYAALELGFPADYSTESPDADGLTIDGTLAATSTEDAGGQSTPVTLRITPEGDLFIDDTLPDTVPDETDAPTLVIPSSLLEPVLTDADGSEFLRGFSLVVTGLPAGSTVASLGVVVPAGARAEATAQADGTVTLLIEVGNADGTDPLAAYDALQLTLPTDFSTANRSD